MRKWIENIMVVLLCAFFMVAGTGFNVHCHCQHHSDVCQCAGHSHQAGHCHTHYIHLTDASQITIGDQLPKQSVHELLLLPLATMVESGWGRQLLYRGERVYDDRVPILDTSQQYREKLCQWQI